MFLVCNIKQLSSVISISLERPNAPLIDCFLISTSYGTSLIQYLDVSDLKKHCLPNKQKRTSFLELSAALDFPYFMLRY